jgi:hypothetical protein
MRAGELAALAGALALVEGGEDTLHRQKIPGFTDSGVALSISIPGLYHL